MNMGFKLKAVNKHTLLYCISLALLLVLMQWLQVKYLIIDHANDIFIAFSALLFTGLGIWLALKLTKPKKETVVIEKKIYIEVPVAPQATNADFVMNEKVLDKLGISGREMDVLQLIAKGMSNQEIAEALFVSLNTVKTHSSNLFVKLDVQRRTQAVDKARNLGLIP